MFWLSSSGRIELKMTLKQARSATHVGRCDGDVLELSMQPDIARQLKKIDPAMLCSELKEYGAWDSRELADHDQNLLRILWLAAGDISDRIAQGRFEHRW